MADASPQQAASSATDSTASDLYPLDFSQSEVARAEKRLAAVEKWNSERLGAAESWLAETRRRLCTAEAVARRQ